jgi:hypothetical protein
MITANEKIIHSFRLTYRENTPVISHNSDTTSQCVCKANGLSIYGCHFFSMFGSREIGNDWLSNSYTIKELVYKGLGDTKMAAENWYFSRIKQIPRI